MDDFIAELVEALNLDDDTKLAGDTDLESTGGWDSLGKFMLQSSIFTTHDVTLEVAEINNAKTVGDLWNLIVAAQSAGA